MSRHSRWLSRAGMVLVLAVGIVAVGTSTAQAGAAGGLGLSASTAESSYPVAESVTARVTVTNRGATACGLAATADGGLEVLAVLRDGHPVSPTCGRTARRSTTEHQKESDGDQVGPRARGAR